MPDEIDVQVQAPPQVTVEIEPGQGPAGPQPPLSGDTPQPIGAAGAAGGSLEASASDHVHAHGNQAGGVLHALAGADAGFMSPAQVTKLAGVEPGAQVNTVASVFGRAGAIAALIGDYTALLVTHAVSGLGATVHDALVALKALYDSLAASLVALTATVAAKIGFADLSVADAAALAAVAGPAGAPIFVRSFRDFFVASNRAAPPAVDGVKVVTHPSGGTWRWERLNLPHPSWALQTSVYINSSTGNDQNDASQATSGGGLVGPIKTFQEFVRRTGASYRLQTEQVIFAAGDFTNDPWDQHIVGASNNGRSLLVRGTLTQATAVTGATVTNFNRTTNADQNIAASWTAANEVGRLIIDGAGNSAFGMDVGGGAGDLVTDIFHAVPVTTAAGAPVNPGSINPSGTSFTSFTFATILRNYRLHVSGPRALVFADVDFSAEGDSRIFGGNVSTFFLRCRFPAAQTHCGGALYYVGCRFTVPSLWGNEYTTRAFVCGGHATVDVTNGLTSLANITYRGDFVSAGSVQSFAQGSRAHIGAMCIRKVTGTADGIMLYGGATARIAGALWGAGNTSSGTMWSLDRNCYLEVNSSQLANITCTFTGGDLALGAQRASSGAAGAKTGRAFDNSTGTYTAARNLTFALLNASIATGFAGQMAPPDLGSRVTVQ